MHRFPEIIAVACSVTGSIMVSYVESRIVSKTGLHGIAADPIIYRYWRRLSMAERFLFWAGVPVLIVPFLLVLIG